jgi:hypothetical protein
VCFLVVVTFVLFYGLDHIQGFRPHGRIIAIETAFGVFFPSVMIGCSAKLRSRLAASWNDAASFLLSQVSKQIFCKTEVGPMEF